MSTQQQQQPTLTQSYSRFLDSVERDADGDGPLDYRTAAEAIIDSEVQERGWSFLTAIITLSDSKADPDHWSNVGYDESTPGGALRCIAVQCVVDDLLERR